MKNNKREKKNAKGDKQAVSFKAKVRQRVSKVGYQQLAFEHIPGHVTDRILELTMISLS